MMVSSQRVPGLVADELWLPSLPRLTDEHGLPSLHFARPERLQHATRDAVLDNWLATSRGKEVKAPSALNAAASRLSLQAGEPAQTADGGSKTWDDWYDQAAGPAGPSRAPSTRPARLLTDLSCTGRKKEEPDILEGLVHTTERVTDKDQSETSKYMTRRPAPSHPYPQVVTSLVETTSQAVSSDLFQWDSRTATYRWTGAVQQQARAQQYLQLIKEIQRGWKGKGRAHDADDEAALPKFEEWTGAERITGMSSAATQSVLDSILEIGTGLRRLQEHLAETQTQVTRRLVPESSALLHAVEVVLQWAGRQLEAWAAVASRGGLVSIEQSNKDMRELISALSELLGCAFYRRPPFRFPFRLDDTASVLSHVYAHYTAVVASQAPAMVQHTLLWILENASTSYRNDLAAWIGWPGATASSAVQAHQSGIGEDAVGARSGDRESASHRLEPWTGAQVEWGFDVRGEEDVGYRLLPAKLPTFISLAKARTLLEAGRALRLLRKAADPSHPLLQAIDRATEGEEQMGLPSWLASGQLHNARARQLATKVKDLQHAIAAWRSRRSGSGAGDGQVPFPAIGQPARTAHSAIGPSSSPYDLMLQRLAEPLPHLGQDLDDLLTPQSNDDLEQLDVWLASAAGNTHAADHERPAQRLLELLLQWAKLINAALISVFFRDVAFPTYLDTCRQFLLLGNPTFSDSLRELLFEDNIEFDELHMPLLARGQAPARSPGEGLSRALASSSWPPPPAQISTRFNSAVIEAVSKLREAAEDAKLREANAHGGRGRFARDALKDLDERLSFALVDPSLSRIRGHLRSEWENPMSIDALDWLTLSFHPPSLIAPLLTQHTQLSYQRILNFLLRIMRVRVVLRGVHVRLVKLRGRGRGRKQQQPRGINAGALLDQSSLLGFHARAQHFIAGLAGYVEQVAIDDVWGGFQARLKQLQKSVEAQDDSFLQDTAGLEDEAQQQHGGDGNSTAGFAESRFDEAGAHSAHGGGPAPGGDGSPASQHSLKDVFSLALYHERVLDRMITACFQKQRQSTIGGLINELFDLILQFSRRVLHSLEEAEQRQDEDSDEEADAAVETLMQRAHKMNGRMEAKFSVLVRALRIVEQSGRKSNLASAYSAATSKSDHRPANASGLSAGALEEIRKQEEEADEDLRMLESESTARKSGSEGELAAQLLARLDLTRRYV